MPSHCTNPTPRPSQRGSPRSLRESTPKRGPRREKRGPWVECRHGACSAVVSAPVCGSGGREFKSHHAPRGHRLIGKSPPFQGGAKGSSPFGRQPRRRISPNPVGRHVWDVEAVGSNPAILRHTRGGRHHGNTVEHLFVDRGDTGDGRARGGGRAQGFSDGRACFSMGCFSLWDASEACHAETPRHHLGRSHGMRMVEHTCTHLIHGHDGGRLADPCGDPCEAVYCGRQDLNLQSVSVRS